MNFYGLELLSRYGMKTVIIALIATTISFITEKLCKDKFAEFKSYFPLVYSIIFEYVSNAITVRSLVFTADAFYSGLITGSLATAFSVFIKKIASGKSVDFFDDVFFIEGLLPTSVPSDKRTETAKLILSVFNSKNGKTSYPKLAELITRQALEKLNVSLDDKIALTIICKILQVKNK